MVRDMAKDKYKLKEFPRHQSTNAEEGVNQLM